MEDYKYFPTIMYIQIIIINLMNLDLISTITMMISLPHTCTAIFNYKSAENLMRPLIVYIVGMQMLAVA